MASGGSGYQEIDRGVDAGLMLSSPRTPGAAGDMTAVDFPAAAVKTGCPNQSTPSGTPPPTTTVVVNPTRSSGSRRRLTSLSLRNASGSADDSCDSTTTTTRDKTSRLHISKLDSAEEGAQCPTPGSTMRTKSTSSFSSWSVGSLYGPRESSTKVPDIHSIADLAIRRAGRVSAAKVGPSPTSSSIFSEGSFCSTTPVKQSREPQERTPRPPPGSPLGGHHTSYPNIIRSNHASRETVFDVAEFLVKEEEERQATRAASADAAAGAEAAEARARPAEGMSAGSGISRRTRRPPPSRPSSREQQRRKHQQSMHDNLLTPRPAFNPYHAAAKTVSPASLDNDARQQRKGEGRQRRSRAKKDGTMARGGGCANDSDFRGQKRGQQLGGRSRFGSSRSSSSSSASSRSAAPTNTCTVEWIWPASGTGSQPRCLAGHHGRTVLGCSPITAVNAGPSVLRPNLSCLSSSSSSPPSSVPQSSSLSSETAMWSRREGRGVTGTASHNTTGAREGCDAGHFYRAGSGECGGAFQPPARGNAAWAAALARAEAASQEAPTRSSIVTAPASIRAANPEKCGTLCFGVFHPDGRGGWVDRPVSSLSPSLLDGAVLATRAVPSASNLTSAFVGPRTDAADEDEDLADLAPLPLPSPTDEVSARSGTGVAASQSSDVDDNNVINQTATGEVTPSGRWWSVIQRWFHGRGGRPPTPPSAAPPVPQEENNLEFLNPFSPASLRRFSVSFADAGAASDDYDSGDSFFDNGGAAAAPRSLMQVFYPIADFEFEKHVIGCIFGDDGTTSGGEEASTRHRERDDDEGEQEEESGRAERQEKDCLCHPIHPPLAPCLLLDTVRPLPADVSDHTAAAVSAASTDGDLARPSDEFSGVETAATTTVTFETAKTRAFRPPRRPTTTPSSTSAAAARSVWASHPASPSAAEIARAAAAAATPVTAASVPTTAAAAAAREARDAYVFSEPAIPVAGVRGPAHGFSPTGGPE